MVRMLKSLLAIIFVSVLISTMPAEAGIGIFEGSTTLNALESKTLCNLMIYSTLGGNVSYHVSYSSDIARFVSTIAPNDFYLKTIECPQEGEARRACIRDLCLNKQDGYCRVVCTTFTGPFEVSMDPKPTQFNGAVRDSASIGSANIMNAQGFIIYYTPYDLKLIILYIIIAGGIVAAIFYFFKKSKARNKAKRKR